MKAVVTGGGGFLGGALCRQLVAAGWAVRSASRGRYESLDALGVEQIAMDLGEPAEVAEAVEGSDVVFHTAALTTMAGRRADFERTNVEGTRNVIAACRERGISRLVYSSTPSVVHAGTDVEAVDESAPYADRFLAEYPRTKAIAEREVLAANDAALATVALRPHLIWGPGDPHFIPQLVARARSGQLRLVGDGRALVDTVYIEDAARAHLLAAERLGPGAACAGRPYFVTQGEPRPMGEMINALLDACGAPPVTRSVSPRVAYLAGAVFETFHTVFRRPGVPRMTRFIARQLSTAHWFDISAARRDLGYEPQHTVDEALAELRAAWSGGQPAGADGTQGGSAASPSS